MSRQKEFDRDEVLDRALDLFWQRGYEATSVQDLVAAMGIHRGSLYATFGEKRALFLAALERYEHVGIETVLAELERPGPVRESVRRVFEGVVREAAASGGRRGCFAINTAMELAPHDPAVAARVDSMLRRVEGAFEAALIRAQARGEIAVADPRALARFLTATLQGLRMLARAGTDCATLTDVVEVALRTV
jgi:TetR/AcrR family transcriptional repressor of nem operon